MRTVSRRIVRSVSDRKKALKAEARKKPSRKKVADVLAVVSPELLGDSKMTKEEYEEALLYLLKRAKDDFLTYVLLFHDADKFKLGDLHRFLIGIVQGVSDKELPSRIATSVPPQHGKLLDNKTPILTTDGWKTHGDLKPGYHVFHPSGKAVKVLAESQEDSCDVEIELSTGEKIVCHERHEWLLHKDKRHARIVEAGELLDVPIWRGVRGERGSRMIWQLPFVSSLEPGRRILPIHPYYFGYWLGNGRSVDPTLTISDEDAHLADSMLYVSNGSNQGGHTGQKSRRYYYSNQGIVSELKALGVHGNKHIPNEYFTASKKQRLELLAGLIDSDGSLHKPTGHYRFTNSNPQLIEDVKSLIYSFGWKCSESWSDPALSSSGIEWTVPHCQLGFTPTEPIPCKVVRKQSNTFVKRRRVGIVAVRRVGQSRGKCIQVDSPDGLYLAGRTLQPTHNSTILSVEAASWLVGRFPGKQVAITGYSFDLTTDFSKAVRDRVQDPLYQCIFKNTTIAKAQGKVNNWKLTNGSGVVAKSVGSKLTGRRVDHLIIDDPHAGRAEAESTLQRERVRQWYFGDCVTRLSPDACIYLIGTRFHPEDLIGSLTDSDFVDELKVQGAEDEIFRVINLKAISDGEDDDMLGRAKGEPLFPEVRHLKFLNAIRAMVPGYEWDSQYQGTPRVSTTNIIDTSRLDYVDDDQIPWDSLEIVRGWDLALTEKQTSDWSTGVLVGGLQPDDDLVAAAKAEGLPIPLPTFYILDVVREKMNWTKLRSKIVSTALADLDLYGAARMGMEAVLAFEIALLEVRKALAGRVVVEKRNPKNKGKKNQSSKLMRAQPWINLVEVGNVRIRRAKWNKPLISEMLTFPDGDNDDQIDGISVGYETLFLKHKLLLA